jgi:hypothetical protein
MEGCFGGEFDESLMQACTEGRSWNRALVTQTLLQLVEFMVLCGRTEFVAHALKSGDRGSSDRALR